MLNRRLASPCCFPPALPRAPALAQDKSIVVASTTSTQDSGLFGHLLPLFKAKSGIDVKVIAQGTGQALDTARRGDADVVLVHAKPQEEKFVADGFGVKRFDLMYNDFVLIGPTADPAGHQGNEGYRRGAAGDPEEGSDVRVARRQVGHACRRACALEAGRRRDRDGKGPWYREIGQGMGAALNMAARATPMCSPTAAPGCRSRIPAISSLPSKATGGCSTSTASSSSIRRSIRP